MLAKAARDEAIMTDMTQRLKLRHFPRLPLIFAGIASLCLSGCDNAQPVSYQIPKETREVNLPMPAAAPAAQSNMQTLPGMQAAADAAGEIAYAVPESWTEAPASGIRKANFNITTDTGSAEVTVLTFPGDVGGQLANINRWRGQIGLPDITTEQLPECTESTEIAKHGALYTRLEGTEQSILGALLPFHGNTWFFKMQGDTATVLAQEAAMKQFLASVEMTSHAH